MHLAYRSLWRSQGLLGVNDSRQFLKINLLHVFRVSIPRRPRHRCTPQYKIVVEKFRIPIALPPHWTLLSDDELDAFKRVMIFNLILLFSIPST